MFCNIGQILTLEVGHQCLKSNRKKTLLHTRIAKIVLAKSIFKPSLTFLNIITDAPVTSYKLLVMPIKCFVTSAQISTLEVGHQCLKNNSKNLIAYQDCQIVLSESILKTCLTFLPCL